ncbi:MAG: hypothetical protein Q8Q31_01570 [Nanoarchaeota archaeon]|nr:hypothetical protein [Nanoarchaeota archaeon]
MFEWFFGKRDKNTDEETKRGFDAVKKDMETVGKWIKHLDGQDKQLLDSLNELKHDLSSIKDEIAAVREALSEISEEKENKQVFEKMPVFHKQTGVLSVEKAVQTPVQTANFLDILKNLSSNERLIVFTLLNSDLKLSYEDLALLLGKERSTIRGQINAIKQKSEGLIKELTEKTGKKRVYIPEEIKEKLSKYGKVRVKKKSKGSVNKESSV